MTWPHGKLKFVARFGYGDILSLVYSGAGIFTRSLRATVDLLRRFYGHVPILAASRHHDGGVIMDSDRCSYGIDASDSDRVVLVLRQGGKIVLRRCLDLNPGAVAALTDLIRKSQGKPVICINSTGEVAFSLAFTITNDIPCADVMLVFPHALRHAATTATRLGNPWGGLERGPARPALPKAYCD
jgi:hypothetical protein